MAGTQSVWADDPRLLGIPRSRQTVAIIYPQHSTVLHGFPPASGQGPPTVRVPHTGGLKACMGGPVQDGAESRSHPRRVSVLRVRPRTSGSITDLLLALACVHWAAYTAPQRSWKRTVGALGPRPGAPRRAGGPTGCETQGYWEADVSLVIGINQTNHSTNQERPCTTIRGIKKELSICPS